MDLQRRLIAGYVVLACLIFGTSSSMLRATEAKMPKMNSGPLYVPLDSWIYSALKRLTALGYAPDTESLAAPWTREQCRMLLWEAADIASRRTTDRSAPSLKAEAGRLLASLQRELGSESPASTQIAIESVYVRQMQIMGTPLTDSFHTGQTIVNDFGRPFGQGRNSVAGLSAHAQVGRFSAYFRGEYQSAMGRGALDGETRTLFAALDGVPHASSSAIARTSHFIPLQMYVGMHLGKFDITVGKQSLWWGPGYFSSFHFSSNAAPLSSVLISQAEPIVLPGLLKHLGRIRTQFLVGQLSGHSYPPRPFVNAQKISLQLTSNLELGFTRSAVFGGVGHPLTVRSIAKSFFSTSSRGSTEFGTVTDAGDRRSGFDFRWRLPGLRRYVTLYSDSLADDDPSPLANPKRSAWGPGVYIASLPRIPRLDLRVETYSTWLYRKDEGGRFIYWNNQYRDGYTNGGNLLGSWVGRDARAYVASSTYWFSGPNKISATYRQVKTSSKFLPGGGTQTDVSVDAQWEIRPHCILRGYVQLERYFVPVLGPSRQNLAAAIQVTVTPREWAFRR